MSYKLFLDDIRHPNECALYMHKRVGKANSIYLEDWIIVRDYHEFIDTIDALGLPDVVSFDHDLAEIHYDPSTWTESFKYDEETGLDCAKWLVDYHMENEPKLETFPVWMVHSMNPGGTENIKSYIQNYLKTLK